jgi:hypothetical protein
VPTAWLSMIKEVSVDPHEGYRGAVLNTDRATGRPSPLAGVVIVAKERVRDVYGTDDPEQAVTQLDAPSPGAPGPKLRRLAKMSRRCKSDRAPRSRMRSPHSTRRACYRVLVRGNQSPLKDVRTL